MTYKTLPQPLANNRQVKEYIDAAQKGKNTSFIALFDDGWIVRSLSTPKDLKIFTTKQEAISYAEDINTSIVFLNQDE